MTVKEYVLKRLNQGETDLHVLARQTRIQFPSFGISFSYIKRIRNEWRKASALQEEASVWLAEREGRAGPELTSTRLGAAEFGSCEIGPKGPVL